MQCPVLRVSPAAGAGLAGHGAESGAHPSRERAAVHGGSRGPAQVRHRDQPGQGDSPSRRHHTSHHIARHNHWRLLSATAPDPAPAPRWPIISSYHHTSHQNNILSGVHPHPDSPRPLLPARQGDRAREAVSSQHLPGDQGAALQVPASHTSYLTLCAGEGVSAGLRPRPPQHAVHRPRAGGGGGGGGHQGRGLNSAQCEYCRPMFEMRGG